MSVVIPFLAVLLAGAFAAYHRLRLVTWVAISAALLAACWFLGAHPTATLVAAGIVAAVTRVAVGSAPRNQHAASTTALLATQVASRSRW